jgi:hypothetical protein
MIEILPTPSNLYQSASSIHQKVKKMLDNNQESLRMPMKTSKRL